VAGASKIYVVPSGGGDPKPVRPEFANARDPLWMPGGEHLLFLGRSDPKAPREKTLDWWVTPVDQGSAVKTGAFAALQGQKLVAPPGETAIAPGAWIPSGNRVVFAATLGDTTNLWQIALSAEGKAAPQADRFTFGTGVETHPSAAASPQGAQVTFSNLGLNVDVWSLPLDGNQGKVRGPLERLTQEVSFDGAPSPSADGRRLAFLSSRWGRPIVWMRDLGSGKEAALTAGRQEQFQPKVSGDGSRVVYTERESGKEIAYVVAAAGGAAEKLCEGCGIATHLSFDGTKVLLESESHPESLLLVDTRDRRRFEPIRTTPGSKLYVFAGRLSPDERWISFHTRPSPVTRQVFVAPFRGGPTVSPKEWTPITDGSAADRETYWSPDGNLLYFLSDRDRFMCIWAQRLHPQTKRPEGPAFAVQHLHSARRSFAQVGVGAIGMSVVRDRLFFALGALTSNVWMKTEMP
jgi:Tol biopolymer transport system component